MLKRTTEAAKRPISTCHLALPFSVTKAELIALLVNMRENMPEDELAKLRFTDDNNLPVETVTAEQHALDNPMHLVGVLYTKEDGKLQQTCGTCEWWDDTFYKETV